MVWPSLPPLILPSGMRTRLAIPAAAAYDASEADVLPVLAQATIRAPTALAWLTPTVIPRSLNDAVGLCPSCLTPNPLVRPAYPARRSSQYRGVLPSARVTIADSGMAGRSAWYRQTPEVRSFGERSRPIAAGLIRESSGISTSSNPPHRGQTVTATSAGCGVPQSMQRIWTAARVAASAPVLGVPLGYRLRC